MTGTKVYDHGDSAGVGNISNIAGICRMYKRMYYFFQNIINAR